MAGAEGADASLGHKSMDRRDAFLGTSDLLARERIYERFVVEDIERLFQEGIEDNLFFEKRLGKRIAAFPSQFRFRLVAGFKISFESFQWRVTDSICRNMPCFPSEGGVIRIRIRASRRPRRRRHIRGRPRSRLRRGGGTVPLWNPHASLQVSLRFRTRPRN